MNIKLKDEKCENLYEDLCLHFNCNLTILFISLITDLKTIPLVYLFHYSFRFYHLQDPIFFLSFNIDKKFLFSQSKFKLPITTVISPSSK